MSEAKTIWYPMDPIKADLNVMLLLLNASLIPKCYEHDGGKLFQLVRIGTCSPTTSGDRHWWEDKEGSWRSAFFLRPLKIALGLEQDGERIRCPHHFLTSWIHLSWALVCGPATEEMPIGTRLPSEIRYARVKRSAEWSLVTV